VECEVGMFFENSETRRGYGRIGELVLESVNINRGVSVNYTLKAKKGLSGSRVYFHQFCLDQLQKCTKQIKNVAKVCTTQKCAHF
jgi:hypothetical protein